MRISKINSTISQLNKPLKPIIQKKDTLLKQCAEVKHKNIKDISTKDIPFLGAVAGFFTPIPLGFLIGFGIGKMVEVLIRTLKK